MKKMMFTLLALMAMTATASAMSYEQARNEALFLTDKMAYELNLTDAQYEAAYEINLDYLMGVTSPGDVYGVYWERRNLDLSYILYSWQWDAFRAATYFFRPLVWDSGYWHFTIYRHYPHRDYFYFGRPHFYATYRGGHSWHSNGGHSFYHGHSNHFRPELSHNHQHFGMRDGYDRGNYRNARDNSSTRVTAGRGNYGTQRGGNDRNFGTQHGRNGDRDNRQGGNAGYDNRQNENNRTGNPHGSNSGYDNHRGGNSGNGNSSRSFGSSSSTNRSVGSSTGTNRSVGSSSGANRSFGSSSRSNSPVGSVSPIRSGRETMHNGNAGTIRSTGSPNRSFGSGSSHSSAPARSSAPSRSSGGSASSRGGGSSSNSGGHFGGRR